MLLAMILLALSAGVTEPVTTDLAGEIVAEIDKMAKTELWPDFDPRQTPIAIYDGARTTLFRHPNPPEGFTECPQAAGALCYEGRHESIRANTSTDLNGVSTATLIVKPEEARTVQDWAAVAVHEIFHVFQRAHHPAWQANEADLFVYPMGDAALLALRRLESLALERALATADDNTAAAWTKALLTARGMRFAFMEENFAAYERGNELNEGLARYVQQRAAGKTSPPVFPAGGYAAHEVRLRSYAVGEGLGLLLDRFRPDWKTELESGDDRPLDKLLKEVVAKTAGPPAEFTADDKKKVQEEATAHANNLRTQNESRRREFLAQPGWTVIVINEGSEPLWPQGFDPLNVFRVTEREILHTRFLKLGNSLGSLEVLDLRSLTEAAGEHPLFNGVGKLTVTGLPAEPETQEEEGKLIISGEGFRAEFRAAQVERSGNTLIIKLTSN
jgi:hypothetical protein